MDVKQISYIVKIADECSITRAAEKLYLTQSALNQQLLRLEKELGTPLFYRSKSELKPTPAGMIYLKNAREILRIRNQTYSIINDMVDSKKGQLSIGFTPGRGIEMFTQVYPEFHRQFPQVTLAPQELSVHRQQALIRQGDLDIGFMTLSEQQKTQDEYLLLGTEPIVLVVPDIHPLAISKAPKCPSTAISAPTAGSEFPTIDLSTFRHEPFVLMYQESSGSIKIVQSKDAM